MAKLIPIPIPTLKAATLVETIAASVIVTLAFGIGLVIFMNLLRSSNARQEMNARMVVNELAVETKQYQRWIDETIDAPPFTVQKTVSPYAQAANLQVLHLKATDKQGKVLHERKEIIFVP